MTRGGSFFFNLSAWTVVFFPNMFGYYIRFATFKFTYERIRHPIFLYIPIYQSEMQWSWSESQLTSGERWNTSWAGRQFIPDLIQRSTLHTHIHTYSQFRISRWPNLHVLGLWEEIWAPSGNTHRHWGEHAHRKAPVRWQVPPENLLAASRRTFA